MDDGYWLSRLCRRVLSCCILVTLDVLVLSSDFMSFQIESCSIAMARAGNHGY